MDVAAASRLLADVPKSSPAWPDPPPMSTLHALLLFGGVPLALSLGIALLVLAPSLARGPRYRPSEGWDAGAEIFGEAPRVEAGASGARELTARPAAAVDESSDAETDADSDSDSDSEAGGASARW